MDTTINILIAILCISGPLFFLTTIGSGIGLYALYNKNQVKDEEKRKLETKIQELEKRINLLSKNAVADLLGSWCKEVSTEIYSSEIDVEIKFVYLFMRFLGYNMSDLKTRVPIEVPVGRKKVVGIADWVVYNHQSGRPFLVIEAKEPNQQLNTLVQDQARSYAFGLNAPLYLLTNGKEIVVFERKIENDFCLLNVNVKDLYQQWQTVEQILGKNNLNLYIK